MSTRSLHTVSHASFARASLARHAAASAAQLAARAADTVVTWLRRDRDRRALMTLDDRLLQDIGISRSQVEAEIGKPFWRG